MAQDSNDSIAAETGPSKQFQDVVKRWQTKLLDLSRRNKLLYFKAGKSSVRVVEYSSDTISEALAAARQGLSFDYAERRKEPKLPFESDQASAPEPEILVTPGDLSSDCGPLDLQRRLKALQKKDNEWEQEQGMNVLFLAMGFLEWLDVDGMQAKAPLLLAPCDLKRKSVKDPFRLLRESDEVNSNETLVHLMSEQGIDIPEFDDDQPSEYFARVRSAVRKRADWRVSDELYLETFAFNKMAMWRDLERVRLQGTNHPLVLQMADEKTPDNQAGSSSSSVSPLPPSSELAGGLLDDLLDIRDQFTVVSADYSQLMAIETARRGGNLVIHGPPGTGKSQTIVNLIAGLMADGKTILFVSEKRAALEVVKRRLQACRLGVFCLDLHSQYARRAAVYEQFKESIDAPHTVRRERAENVEELLVLRGRLNALARAVHKRIEPLGLSPYEVSGWYASVQHLPAARLDISWIADLDPKLLAKIRELAGRLANKRIEFLEHNTSDWRPLRTAAYGLELPELIRQHTEEAISEIRIVRRSAEELAETLGVRRPVRSVDAHWLAEICKLLSEGPVVPRSWADTETVAELHRTVQSERLCQESRSRCMTLTEEAFGPRRDDSRISKLYEQLEDLSANPENFEAVFGSDWRASVTRRSGEIVELRDALESSLRDLITASEFLARTLGTTEIDNWKDLEGWCARAEEIVRLGPVPPQWFDSQNWEGLLSEVRKAESAAQSIKSAEEEVYAQFTEDFENAVDQGLEMRYATSHQGVLRLLRRQYWRDSRHIRSFLREPAQLDPRSALRAIRVARQVQREKNSWAAADKQRSEQLGNRYVGRDSDWDGVAIHINETRQLTEEWPQGLSTLAALLTSRENLHEIRLALKASGDSRALIEAVCIRLGQPTLVADTPSLRQLLSVTQQCQDITKSLASAIEIVATGNASFDELLATYRSAANLFRIQKDFDQRRAALQKGLGAEFSGWETDWQAVEASVEWSRGLLDLFDGKLPIGVAQQLDERADRAFYSKVSIDLNRDYGAILSQLFREEASPWRNWSQAPFEELADWAQKIQNNAAGVEGWIDYRDAIAGVEAIFGIGAGEEIRRITDNSLEIPGLLTRCVSGAWLDHAFRGDLSLSGFSSTEIQTIREKFRVLDQSLPEAMKDQVRRRCFGRYPMTASLDSDLGQVGSLQREINKKKRRRPVRQLLSELPTLAGALKPCFLMSPLAVSQYLPTEAQFDIVIFDEASQVFPEDAVPTILRGTQVIVVGDQKQLPPTAFFRRAEQEDTGDAEDDEALEDADRFAGTESVLDVMVSLVGQGEVGQQYLRTHYRSRSEALIQFSNQKFYGENPLMVFPEPSSETTSIQDVFVEDGRYEPGVRVNRKEAERVADLIFAAMERYGATQSLGVVALSRSQADYIHELIDLRRADARHLDSFFSSDRPEPFFVKNLENVQGDERDHIVLCIGYGPLISGGTTPNRFGPINSESGGRRLNVAISRARNTMTVVHSLKPSDITSDRPGPKLLREYLEYASNPVDFFARRVDAEGAEEPDSPFEESVLAALRAAGHNVTPQVGIAGYRIDIGIRGDDPSRYVLGIECDGFTFHSSPAARDRDWLRRAVLEGLGWRIHTVWSTAWVRNSSEELRKIEEAIASAKESRADIEGLHSIVTSPPSGHDDEVDVIEPSSKIVEFSVYEPAQLGNFSELTDSDLQSAGVLRLADLVNHIVSVEMPIRADQVAERVRSHWGLKRTGAAIWEGVKRAISYAVTEGVVSWDPSTRTGRIDGRFCVIDGQPIRPRRPLDGEEPRKIELISESEIAEGLLLAIDSMHGGSRDDVILQASRCFGYKRTGGNIQARIGQVVDKLIDTGIVRNIQGVVVRAN